MKMLHRYILAYAGDFVTLLFAIVVCIASFSGKPADAYDFPRLCSALLLGLTLITNMNNLRAGSDVIPIDLALIRRLMPAMGIIVLFAATADLVGFYLSSTIAFAAIAGVYNSGNIRYRWLIAATAIVMICVYLLFNTLLQVQTPEPFWID